MITDFWDIDVSEYMDYDKNSDPISIFTDDEEEYIRQHTKVLCSGEISLKEKLDLANEYRKSFNKV